ncbi:hypothetical protein [Phenylobacterium sp.]|uniref:hypothetical protein n=1 Tax=Phenylobacterium sp. TaxID=1871053 RepID=UPI00121F2EDB|nr:hypothetical protein [Phenylobacterium sp.]THD60600.1 MAG: hypothetical protein E8A49_14340 [Phenylobacterium sp.]
MVLPNLFKGIAVVIDNGVGQEDAIDRILGNIRAGGGHHITLGALPADDYDLEHFSRVSFFIMDWNLVNADGEPLEAGVRLPAALSEAKIQENIAFLKRLSKSRHAPVFIFTNEDPGQVLEELSKDAELQHSVEQSRILVKSKSEVIDKLYDVLEEWAAATPSVLTLKTWERTFVQAANDLFIDLHDRAPYWPVLLWQTFGADGVPPEAEMNRLLNRLVESRMAPTNLNLDSFIGKVEEQRKQNEAVYLTSMHKVLEGERFLREDRLTKDIYAPGDVFAFPVEPGKTTYWINVRAECDCLRGGDGLELYLLQAKIVEDAEKQISPDFGTFNEKDGEVIIFAMMDGRTFSVRFKDMKVKTLKQMVAGKYERVGRLLPPFMTRVQQRYAAYIQRPGMPRIPEALYKTA